MITLRVDAHNQQHNNPHCCRAQQRARPVGGVLANDTPATSAFCGLKGGIFATTLN